MFVGREVPAIARNRDIAPRVLPRPYESRVRRDEHHTVGHLVEVVSQRFSEFLATDVAEFVDEYYVRAATVSALGVRRKNLGHRFRAGVDDERALHVDDFPQQPVERTIQPEDGLDDQTDFIGLLRVECANLHSQRSR